MIVDVRAQEQHLTASGEKYRFYARDPYFREAWADWRDVWGDDAVARAHQLVVVVFKPETVVTRTSGPGLDFLREHGFLPIWCARVAYTRHMNRAAWRYQYQAICPPSIGWRCPICSCRPPTPSACSCETRAAPPRRRPACGRAASRAR